MTRLALAVSICVGAFAQDLTFSLPPARTSITVGGQSLTIVATGLISASRQTVKVRLSADLSDLQDHLTDLLGSQLDRSDRCGERLTVEHAAIQPAPPAAVLTASLHYEKWACVKALGKQVSKRIVGGNAMLPVKLTPVVSEDREVKLSGEVGQIQADGSLGDVLRSGLFGETLQEKIRTSILGALNKGANLHRALPESVVGIAKIGSAAFGDSGAGHLSFELAGEIAAPFDQIRPMLEQR